MNISSILMTGRKKTRVSNDVAVRYADGIHCDIFGVGCKRSVNFASTLFIRILLSRKVNLAILLLDINV